MKLNEADKAFIKMLHTHCRSSQVLESFLMSKKEIYRANRLVKVGLVVKGTFDGNGNNNVYYPEDKE